MSFCSKFITVYVYQ